MDKTNQDGGSISESPSQENVDFVLLDFGLCFEILICLYEGMN